MKYTSLILVVVCSLIFIIQALSPNFTDEFILSTKSAAAKPWTLVSSIFLHADYSHLFYNMLALAMFGLVLENIVGTRKFLLIFFLSGIFAGFASLAFYESVLGASAAIFGVIGALVVIRPRMIAFALGVPMPMIIAAIAWALLDLAGVFYPSNVANIAHLAGLAFGFAFGLFLRRHFPEQKTKKEKPVSDKELDEWEREYMK